MSNETKQEYKLAVQSGRVEKRPRDARGRFVKTNTSGNVGTGAKTEPAPFRPQEHVGTQNMTKTKKKTVPKPRQVRRSKAAAGLHPDGTLTLQRTKQPAPVPESSSLQPKPESQQLEKVAQEPSRKTEATHMENLGNEAAFDREETREKVQSWSDKGEHGGREDG